VNGSSTRPREDWMNYTPADWMNMTPADWVEAMRADWMDQPPSAWWEQTYGGLMNTPPADWWRLMYGPRAPAGAPDAREDDEYEERPGRRGHHRHRHHHRCRGHERHDEGHGRKGGHRHHHPRGCCCHRCRPDACECTCCIGDVDFAVYARLGEQRLIPIVVENERRREIEITPDLSDWTTRGGRPAPVETAALDPKGAFTLPPCGERTITVAVKVRETGDTGSSRTTTPPGTGTTGTPDRTTLPDVDECLVAIADLRLAGCDHRPIRIAVAIVPRSCDPYRVGCGCSCC